MRPARPSFRIALLFGFIASLAPLTPKVADLIFLGLCYAALAGLKHASISKRLTLVLISCAAFSATLAPWIVRNYHLTGQFTLTTQTWQTLSMANNDSGGVYMTREGLAAMPHTTVDQSEIEREGIYRSFFIRWIGENPGRFLYFCTQRALYFWSPLPTYVTGLAAIVATAFNSVLFTLALLFALTQRGRNTSLWPCYVAFATFTVGYSLALVTTRFRLPLYPLLEIMAAGGVLTIWARVRHCPAAALLRSPKSNPSGSA
jgi:hypothetical protein